MMTIANTLSLTKPDMNTTKCDVWILSKVVTNLPTSRSTRGSFETSTRTYEDFVVVTTQGEDFLESRKKGSATNATLCCDNRCNKKCVGQPFGSMPSFRNLSRQESFTHELKFPFPAMASICSSNESSKRIIFIVLPERSNARLSLFSCIGKYHWCNVYVSGIYHYIAIYQNSEAPQCWSTSEASNHNVKTGNAMTTINSTTPPRPAFTWLFLATPLDMPHVRPTVVRVEADTEEQATALLPAFSLVFAAKIRTVAPFRFQIFSGDDYFSFTYEQHGDQQGNISPMEVNHGA